MRPADDESRASPGRSVRVAWQFSLTSILRAAQVTSLVFALAYWFVVYTQRIADNERRLAELQTSMAQQIGELRQTFARGLTDMRQQLSALPDQRSRLDKAERRFADLDARHAGFDARITALEHQVIELRSDMNAITRASNVPLPGGRRGG